jgi:hypothetical protein
VRGTDFDPVQLLASAAGQGRHGQKLHVLAADALQEDLDTGRQHRVVKRRSHGPSL